MQRAGVWLQQGVSRIRRVFDTLEPAYLQPAAQFFFIFLGIQFLAFSIGWTEVAVIIAVSYGTECALSYMLRGVLPSPRAALSAAFSICVFFRATHLYFYALVAAIAIISKYVIRFKGKHIFNPSNFAIVVFALLLPNATTIQFIQWGDNSYVYIFIAAVCFFVSYNTRTLEMALAFLASYFVLFIVSIAYLPQIFAAHHYGLLSPILVIFACFMLTDPKTAPQGRVPRILYAISIALTYFTLELYGVRYSIFIALFIVLFVNALSAPLMGLLRRISAFPFIIPNLAAFILLFAVFSYSYATNVFTLSRFANASLPSTSFVLFGIQSNELFACTQGEVFNPRNTSGVESPAETLGAAWGDYDNDGHDDLFVSNWDKPSRLYHNNGDGTFTDVTEQAGLPLQSSASAFFVDYDNSGQLSLFVVSPHQPDPERTYTHPLGALADSGGDGPMLKVYKNRRGTFTEVTSELGLEGLHWPKDSTGSMSFADYNNDGQLDFVISSPGKLLSLDLGNQAFSRSDIDPDFTTSGETLCGVDKVRAVLSKEPRPSDPWLAAQMDAFIAPSQEDICMRAFHSPRVSSETEAQIFTAEGGGNYTHSYNLILPGSVHLFTQKNGKFEEHPEFADYVHSIWKENASGSLLAGATSEKVMSGRYFQPISFDFDGDGKPDIFITVDFGRNLFLKNMGNLKFEDKTAADHLDISGSGMGVTIGDYDHSGRPSIFVTNGLDDYLFTNNGGGSFKRIEQEIARLGVGWGTSFLDYTLNGSEGLFIANGDLARTNVLPATTLGVAFFRADNLYRNDDGVLVDRTWKDFCSDFQSGKALAVSDYDNDGDPDVFVGNTNTTDSSFHIGTMSLGKVGGNNNVLYENSTNGPDKKGHSYLKIKLHGIESNSMGIGATVQVKGGGITQSRFAVLGESFYSQNSQWMLFGLGTDSSPVAVDVSWPSGHHTTLQQVATNQALTISESQ